MSILKIITATACLVGAMSAAAAQTAANGPLPTPEMQKHIDIDNSRHFGSSPADPGPLATDLSPRITPDAIDKATRKVADWQLAESQPYFDRIWTWSALYVGFLAASDSTGDPKYRAAMQAMSEKFAWQERSHQPNADDLSISQTYVQFYLDAGKKDPSWIAPTQAEMAGIINLNTLPKDPNKIPWWWCDALFMAPPAWARMYAATGDRKYVDYLDLNWKRSYDLLWDKDEHLYARDATYIPQRGANGKKIFWSRGEGWVMAGLSRTLPLLPKNDPRRGFYEQQLRDMAAAVTKLQDPATGLWHSSLLDPLAFPAPEVSGSALMTFAMAWGIDNGVLGKEYVPVVTRAWRGMLQHIYADGRLGDIQQTGAEPAYYLPSASYNFGVGAFLLAGAEMHRLATSMPALAAEADAAATTDPGLYDRLHLPTPRDPSLPDLFLIGDSTVRNGAGDGAHNQMGWGDEIAQFFDTNRINVVNRAIGGRSSRTYITEGHWAETLKLIKPGDIVLIQFGHNDSGPLDDTARARGSLPGVGEETRAIENPVLKRHEIVHTFGWYLAQYVREIREKGAIPVICSLVPRKTWVSGKIERNTSTYRGWTAEVAARDHVDYIDLNEITAEKYDALGQAGVEPLFGDPHTHTTAAGAVMNAESVVAGLTALPDDPLAKDFSAKAASIPAFTGR